MEVKALTEFSCIRKKETCPTILSKAEIPKQAFDSGRIKFYMKYSGCKAKEGCILVNKTKKFLKEM